MNLTRIRASALALFLLPTSAFAGINVRTELEVGSALPVVIVQEFNVGHHDEASSATVVYEGGTGARSS